MAKITMFLFITTFVLICLSFIYFFFFFKQKTAYDMRISDWSSDVCSSDLVLIGERSIKPFPVLGRYERGNLLQHLILERATGRGDKRCERLFLRRRNTVRDEPAKKTVNHPGRGQAQLAKLGDSQRGRSPNHLTARPAKYQKVENTGKD